MKRKFVCFFAFLFVYVSVRIWAQDPMMYWDFEKNDKNSSQEVVSGKADTLEGYFQVAEGLKGLGIRFDGFTTCLRRSAENLKNPDKEFTIEAWVALGNYPWNWCPIITTASPTDEVKGYRLMLGPLGQVSLQTAIEGQWISCSSQQEVMPLRKWMHIVGTYRAQKDMAVYLNGKLMASIPIQGKIRYSRDSECRIGMVAVPGKPSDLHRSWGTVAAFYGIDGIMDEIKVYDLALSNEQILYKYHSVTAQEPDIGPRKLPSIKKHPGHFGAFYTKLEYYPGWDNMWPVEQDPDVVVCFAKSPVKLIFWRGIRYGAAWVSENDNWMTDQSVEAWEHGADDREGCFEPGNEMFLRHNRLSSYNKAGGCNHFPVGQARCDGRTTRMADRPSHCSGFPISDPVINEEEDADRFYWCGLYGMNKMDIPQLVQLGRSWAFAPELSFAGAGMVSSGYDRSRRCYQLQNRSEKPSHIEFTLNGSEESPVINPAFYIQHWNAAEAEVWVNGKRIDDCEMGLNHKLTGTDLVVFLWMQADFPLSIKIIPK